MNKTIKKIYNNFKKKLKHLNKVIKIVQTDCNKFYITILFDMFISYILYSIDIEEYKIYEFYNINHSQRKTFLNKIKHDIYKRFLYNKNIISIIKNKQKFLTRFSGYIKRDITNVNDISYKKFEEILLENKKIISRSINSNFTTSHEIYDLTKFRGPGYILEKVKKNKLFLVEKYINQHKKLNEISENLVIINVVTMINNIKVDVICSYITYKENDHIIRGYIDMKKSCIKGHLRNENYDIYDSNIVNYEIPKLDEIIQLVKKCAVEIDEIKEVEWSVCIDNKGKIHLMDATTWNNYTFAQIPEYIGKKGGLAPYYKKVIFKK